MYLKSPKMIVFDLKPIIAEYHSYIQQRVTLGKHIPLPVSFEEDLVTAMRCLNGSINDLDVQTWLETTTSEYVDFGQREDLFNLLEHALKERLMLATGFKTHWYPIPNVYLTYEGDLLYVIDDSAPISVPANIYRTAPDKYHQLLSPRTHRE